MRPKTNERIEPTRTYQVYPISLRRAQRSGPSPQNLLQSFNYPYLKLTPLAFKVGSNLLQTRFRLASNRLQTCFNLAADLPQTSFKRSYSERAQRSGARPSERSEAERVCKTLSLLQTCLKFDSKIQLHLHEDGILLLRAFRSLLAQVSLERGCIFRMTESTLQGD